MKKGFVVAVDRIIYGSGNTIEAAKKDAEKWAYTIFEDKEVLDDAVTYPATLRMLAMVALYGGGLEWKLMHGTACYIDESEGAAA